MSQIIDGLFTNTINALNYTQTRLELDQEMQDLISAVKHCNRKGTITLTLSVTPENSGAQVTIVADIKTKSPKMPREKTLFFTLDNNGLSRIDPRQREVPLAVVEDDRPTEFKRVTA